MGCRTFFERVNVFQARRSQIIPEPSQGFRRVSGRPGRKTFKQVCRGRVHGTKEEEMIPGDSSNISRQSKFDANAY